MEHRHLPLASCALVLLTAVAIGAQSPSALRIERLDAALDALIAPGAVPELITGDYFGLIEGPVWVQNGGYLLFSDVAGNRIYKWTPDGQLSTFLDKAGFTGTDTSKVGLESNNGRLHVILLGPNGITLDREGRVVFGTLGDRAVKRVEKDGTVTVLADRFDGKRFSGLNDLVYRSDGTLYFTDFFGGVRGGASSPYRELPFFGVFMLRDGQVQLLDKDPLGTVPNGLAFSPDEHYFYLAAGPYLLRYEVRPDGSIANPHTLYDVTADAGNRNKATVLIDGIKVDRNGNIYLAGPNGVWVLTPDGRHLGTIRIPGVANLAFGGADGRTMYFTARRDLYQLRVTVGGRPPGPRQ